MASREVTVKLDVEGLPRVRQLLDDAKAEVLRLRAVLAEQGEDARIDYLLRDSNGLQRRIKDALALHQPVHYRWHVVDVCNECSHVGGSLPQLVPYPCATVRALTAADPTEEDK